ncbi:hypothetical protein P152DRAFT_10758 [Eremomyces bilateralis CBS 781.70]|uniref:RRM domain-containing protein n=1 Tax=Eremomyces bilateralis CBS 781.70 TaxID=1392243 RepID=A0A6G1GGT5_9PEZI|nr:uncharacterized protein P152DRAFT_10758 [Eremomyces bilateralis CBS 781.70]KAF1817202.1 hypothetical protein P152DRAFT_10758 [Eremomyces bilateralis CBS 781.70]
MSNQLEKSLGDILTEKRNQTRQRRPVRRAAVKAKPAPVGGVTKKTKAAKAAEKAIVSLTGSAHGSKILVSNLPRDVEEKQIEEFFGKKAGPTKRVTIAYGADGKSRGTATIIFRHEETAAKAAKELDGLRIDGKPIRIEVLLSPKSIPSPAAPKTLAERASGKPGAKPTPKPATANKAAKGKKTSRGRNAGRPKSKTADELDAEMADYFDASADTNMANGAVQPASGGDTGMTDEIM